MKMSFEDLKKQIVDYITRPHHHSTWNLEYLHFNAKYDKSSRHNKHYYVCYGDKSRRFKIAMCNNNIKLMNVSNIPGSFHDNKGRILGACLDFVRHNGNPAHNSHDYSKDRKANKWEQYDIQQFDKNDLSSNTPLDKDDKNIFDKSAKDVAECVNSLKTSKAFKKLVNNMQKCGFALLSYGQEHGNAPFTADFMDSHETSVYFNSHTKTGTFANPNGLNLVKVAKPRLFIYDYYISIHG